MNIFSVTLRLFSTKKEYIFFNLGFWIPDSAKEKIKVPVAIKVLRDESSQKASNEILDASICFDMDLARKIGGARHPASF